MKKEEKIKEDLNKRKHILFIPDGNRRYASKERVPYEEVYKKGAETLNLFNDFFLLENGWDELTMHYMSKYTHERDDGSLKPIYEALEQKLQELYENKHFLKNNIEFQWINHSEKLPSDLESVCKNLEEQTNGREKVVRTLLGYDLNTDRKNAFENSKTYEEFKKNLLIPSINLVLRTTEMRLSGGPVYAMDQAQMIQLPRYNPELKKEDLDKVLCDYENKLNYRKTTNPVHRK